MCRLKADLFRVLGHPVRVRLLAVLADDEYSVGQLQGALQLGSSGASQHLALLRRHGVVRSRKDGTAVYYGVRDQRTPQLLELAQQILASSPQETGALLGRLDEQADGPSA